MKLSNTYITRILSDKNPAHNDRSDRTTPLHYAAKNGHLEVYKCIAAQVNNKNPVETECGTTALHYAARNGHIEIVKYILEFIDDANLKDNEGTTPMHRAAQQGYYEICKILINHGADPNPINDEGTSAIDLAGINAPGTSQEIRDLILRNPKKIQLQTFETKN